MSLFWPDCVHYAGRQDQEGMSHHGQQGTNNSRLAESMNAPHASTGPSSTPPPRQKNDVHVSTREHLLTATFDLCAFPPPTIAKASFASPWKRTLSTISPSTKPHFRFGAARMGTPTRVTLSALESAGM